jgi:hypothetical protein
LITEEERERKGEIHDDWYNCHVLIQVDCKRQGKMAKEVKKRQNKFIGTVFLLKKK